MTSRIWSTETVRVVTKALDEAKEHQGRVTEPNARLCLDQLVYIIEVFVNQEVRRANDA
jgi:hypothetical protein